MFEFLQKFNFNDLIAGIKGSISGMIRTLFDWIILIPSWVRIVVSILILAFAIFMAIHLWKRRNEWKARYII